MVIPASVDACPSEAFESGSELENFDIKEESWSEVEQFISSNDMYFNESSNNDANSNSNGSEFEDSDSENSFDDDYATGARTRSQQKNQRRTASRYNNINKENRKFDMDEQSSGDEYMDDDDDYEDDDDDYEDEDEDEDDDDDYAEDDGNDNDNDNAIDNEKPLLLTKRKRPQEEDLTPSSSEESEEDTSTVSKPATKMGLRENTLPIRKQPQDRLYCPYRGCIRSSLQRSEIYSHIRAKHNSKFPSLAHMVNVRVRLGFKTVGGKVIDFSENSRNILNDKDEILIERQEKSEGSYFCPYQSCNNRISSFRACNIYRHIRQKHDAEFPKVTTYGCFYNFKTLTGKIIDFTG
ncbi:hypothetical protein BDC45DRAFT_138744 [Circinella umbellata]|nr:hypothetical protein BDC45DRAFT_138744 [Circinella umbellata]